MGIRRSEIQQAADNNPDVKHVPPRANTLNAAFVKGAGMGRRATGDMRTASASVPVNSKPQRNKATK